MLNSNFFSKRHFVQNIEAFNLWLQQQYGITFRNTELDKQIDYFTKYISFINYRQKYKETRTHRNTPYLTPKQEFLISQLLQAENISLNRSSR